VNTQQVPLPDIDYRGSFTISFPEENKFLAYSLKKEGVIVPPVLYKSSGRYRIVTGKRRIFWLKKVGIKTVPAHIINVDRKRAFVLGFWDNFSSRPLNSQEKINVLYGLRYICRFPWKKILEEFVPFLGLPSNIYFLKRLLNINFLPSQVKVLLSTERISYENCFKLMSLSCEELKVFLQIIGDLNLGRNKISDILSFYILLKKRRDINIPRILKEMLRIKKDNEHDFKSGFLQLRQFLFDKTHPHLAKDRKKAKNLIMKIKPHPDIKLFFPMDFEDKYLQIEFCAKDVKDFFSKVNSLTNISPQELRRFFQLL